MSSITTVRVLLRQVLYSHDSVMYQAIPAAVKASVYYESMLFRENPGILHGWVLLTILKWTPVNNYS